MRSCTLLAAIFALATFSAMAAEPAMPKAAIPFSQALETAAVIQDRLDDIQERSLILGNGDLNGLVYSEGGNLVLRITKNDVWDARVDTSADPPLLKIDVKNKKLTGPLGGPIPSWDKPYPCPRACADVLLGDSAAGPLWRQIRAEGRHNAFQFRDGAAVMSVEGAKGASNGYACGPLDISTTEYPSLQVKLAGSPNAQFYVDVMDPADAVVFKTGWTDSPKAAGEQVYQLPPGRKVAKIILYTWTTDGGKAENRFHTLALANDKSRRVIDLSEVDRDVPWLAQLDVRRARASLSAPGWRGNAHAKATVLAPATRNVFLIASTEPARLLHVGASYLPAAESGVKDGVRWLLQTLPGDPDWPGMKFAVALAESQGWKAAAVVTSLESGDPLEAAIFLARSSISDAEPLIKEHEEQWAQFWSASGVELDDPELQKMWYRNLYFLRCVSTPGVEAIGLYASLTNDNPPWHGSHTLNYNSEQTFWSAYASNHVELAEPYERMIFRYLPRARWFARQTYDCGGAHIPHNVFTHEIPEPQKCKSKNHRMHAFPPFAHTIGVSGFAVQNLWWHYKYQPDRQYLEKTAYPAVRDVALFYADFIERCEETRVGSSPGKIVLAPSYSPEHWGLTPDFARNRNCAFDIAYARFTLRAAIEGATELGRDAELIARFQKQLSRLPDYPLSKEMEPLLVDVEDAPPISYNIAVPAVPVFPAEQVTWFSPEKEKQLFTRTLQRVKWDGYNSSMIMSIARARLSLPDTAAWVKRELLARSRPNGTITLRQGDRCGHFTEQFAATAAVSELLLQSVDGILRVFPAWPKDKAAKFVNLRAQGGFLVSAEQAAGRVKQVTAISTVGGRLSLLSPWPAIIVRRGDVAPTPLKPDGRGIVELGTQAGERLVFEAESTASGGK